MRVTRNAPREPLTQASVPDAWDFQELHQGTAPLGAPFAFYDGFLRLQKLHRATDVVGLPTRFLFIFIRLRVF